MPLILKTQAFYTYFSVQDNKEELAEDDDWLIGGVGFSNDETLPKDKHTTSSSLADVNKAKFTTLDAFDSKWYVYPTRRIMTQFTIEK